MKILFDDIIQKSDAPKEIKSPALSDTYKIENELEINFDKPQDINCIGLGNCDVENINIEVEKNFVSGIKNWITEEYIKPYIYNNVSIGKDFMIASSENSGFTGKLFKFEKGNFKKLLFESNVFDNSFLCRDILYINNLDLYIAVFTNNYNISIAVSKDGENWTIPQIFSPSYIQTIKATIASGNGLIVVQLTALLNDNTTGVSYNYISSDGYNWDGYLTSKYYQGVIFNDGFFYSAFIENNYLYIHKSKNGIDAIEEYNTNYIIPNVDEKRISSFNFVNGLYYISISHNYSVISLDGINWSQLDNYIGLDIIYGNGLFVSISRTYMTNNYYYNVSIDGMNWSQYTFDLLGIYLFYYNNNFFGAALDIDGLSMLFISDGFLYSKKYISIDNIIFKNNGLYLINKYEDIEKIKITTPCVIGRLAAGIYSNIPTAIMKEPGLKSTASPRVTQSGAVILGHGGYNYRSIALDSRYKINEVIMRQIEAGSDCIAEGYPFFIDLSDESYKLTFDKLYANDLKQQNLVFQSGVKRFLYSYRFEFEERF